MISRTQNERANLSRTLPYDATNTTYGTRCINLFHSLTKSDIYNSDIIINQQEQLINNIERELLLLRESPSNKPPPTPLPPQLPSQTIPRGYIINRDLQFNMTPSPIDLSTVDDLMIEEPNEPAFLKNIPIAIVLHQVEIPNVETEDETCTVAVSYKFTP